MEIKNFVSSIDVLDKERSYLDSIKKRHPTLVANAYEGDARDLDKIIPENNKYDVVVMCGVAQYFND